MKKLILFVIFGLTATLVMSSCGKNGGFPGGGNVVVDGTGR